MKKIIILLILSTFIFSLSGCTESLPPNCEYAKDSKVVACTNQYLDYFDTLVTVTIYYEDSKTEAEVAEIFT